MPLIETMKQVVGSQVFQKHKLWVDKPSTGNKARRADAISRLTVDRHGFTWRADEKSMDRMDRVLSVAGWKFSQLVSQGTAVAAAYTAVYVNRTVQWKDSSDTFRTVTIEQLSEIQFAAVDQLMALWVRYG